MRFFILLFVCLTANITTAQEVWKTYTPKNALVDFTIKSPGKLSYQRDTIYKEYDMIITEAFYYRGDDDKTYMVTHLKYPEKMIPKDSLDIVDDMIDHSIQSSQEALLGRVIYKEDLNDRRYHGKSYRIHYDADRKTLKARIFFYDNSLYNIQVSCPTEKSMDKGIDKFLNSFKLN